MRSAEFGLVLAVLDRNDPNLLDDVVRTMRIPWSEAKEQLDEALERVWNDTVRAKAETLARINESLREASTGC
ncbi:MAG: hypothetical protein ACI8TP_005146 [Acidimicrobiales bacterium]|jgi:hypothetical protein